MATAPSITLYQPERKEAENGIRRKSAIAAGEVAFAARGSLREKA